MHCYICNHTIQTQLTTLISCPNCNHTILLEEDPIKIFERKSNGDYYYNFDRQLHSFDDIPSVIFDTGTKYWHKNDQLHRDNDKPAVIYSDGSQEFWTNGINNTIF